MSAADMFFAQPPVTRTITAAAVLLSVPLHMEMYSPMWVVFLQDYIFTLREIPQLWRIFTAFFITGPKLGLIMDPYFLFTYGKALEVETARFSEPGSFFIYLVFVGVVIILTCGLYLGGWLFLSPLTLALAYTFAQENPNRQMSFFIITFAARWLPYAMLAMTFIMASPYDALLQVTGLIAAHAYDFLAKYWPEYGGGRQLIQTPAVVKGWFAAPPGAPTQRGGGTSFAAGSSGPQNVPNRQAGSGGAFASGSAWQSMGPGRRLGGE